MAICPFVHFCPVQAGLSRLYCLCRPSCLIQDVLPYLSCNGCPASVVLSHMSSPRNLFPSSPVPTVTYILKCTSNDTTLKSIHTADLWFSVVNIVLYCIVNATTLTWLSSVTKHCWIIHKTEFHCLCFVSDTTELWKSIANDIADTLAGEKDSVMTERFQQQ